MICRDTPSGSNGWPLSVETGSQVQMDDHDLQSQNLSYKWMTMILRQIHGKTDDHDLQRQTLRYEWSGNYESNKIAKFRQLASCHLLSWIPLHFHLRVCLSKSLSPFLTNLSLTFMHLNKWPHNWPPEQPTKRQETYELTYFYTYIHIYIYIYIYIYTHTHTHIYIHTHTHK